MYFISKKNYISFVRIQGKQISHEPFSCPKTTLGSLLNLTLFGLVINILVLSANKIGIAL